MIYFSSLVENPRSHLENIAEFCLVKPSVAGVTSIFSWTLFQTQKNTPNISNNPFCQ